MSSWSAGGNHLRYLVGEPRGCRAVGRGRRDRHSIDGGPAATGGESKDERANGALRERNTSLTSGFRRSQVCCRRCTLAGVTLGALILGMVSFVVLVAGQMQRVPQEGTYRGTSMPLRSPAPDARKPARAPWGRSQARGSRRARRLPGPERVGRIRRTRPAGTSCQSSTCAAARPWSPPQPALGRTKRGFWQKGSIFGAAWR